MYRVSLTGHLQHVISNYVHLINISNTGILWTLVNINESSDILEMFLW